MIAIAIASFKEALRKKIFIAIGILTVLYLGIFGVIVYFFVKDMNQGTENDIVGMYRIAAQMVSILGFYFSSMLVAFLTIMLSVGSVSSEIESGILHSIITRPIKRAEYILGKYISLFVLSMLYSLILFSSIIMICSIFKMPTFNTVSINTLICGYFIFLLEPMAILSLAIFGSVVFKTLVNGIFVIAIYILGLIGSMIEQIGSLINNSTMLNLGIFTSLISPFDILYRQMISTIFSSIGLSNPFTEIQSVSNSSPSQWMFVYIAFYIIGLVILAIKKFSKKDLS